MMVGNVIQPLGDALNFGANPGADTLEASQRLRYRAGRNAHLSGKIGEHDTLLAHRLNRLPLCAAVRLLFLSPIAVCSMLTLYFSHSKFYNATVALSSGASTFFAMREMNYSSRAEQS
jgi:hypothetical protein